MGHFSAAFDEHPLIGPDPGQRVVRRLRERGDLSSQQFALVMALSRVDHSAADLVAISEGLVSRDQAQSALAEVLTVDQLDADDLSAVTPEPGDVPAPELLRAGVLPCRRGDGQRCLVMSRPLPEPPPWFESFADWPVAVGARTAIQERLAQYCREALIRRAESRVAEAHSCRSWARGVRLRQALMLLLGIGVIALCLTHPLVVFGALIVWTTLTLLISCALKWGAVLAHMRGQPAPAPVAATSALPVISILVPLFREQGVLAPLIGRLAKLSYPRALLEVILVVEETDHDSRKALAGITLPDWMRLIVVPDSGLRTKPRAMNYALDFCRGTIIGVYDAEDAPQSDQLTKVAQRFLETPRELACLQGILDFYNPRQNWLSRCFAIEYATWFRLILPGFVRFGFAIPLGGTTFFIRRDVLEEIGAWDSHNVTEDADLGFRLCRFGYRSEMIDCVTYEEANCHLWPWIRQRSRWLKGYLMTYFVHMRRPRQLRRDLGWWRFLGFQAHFLSALFQFLLAPVLWSFWLVLFGVSHPFSGIWPEPVFVGLGLLFLFAEGITLVAYLLSISGRDHMHLMKFTPVMHLYWPLSFFAICKAILELIRRPFFWDKTTHGLSQSHIPKLETGDKGL